MEVLSEVIIFILSTKRNQSRCGFFIQFTKLFMTVERGTTWALGALKNMKCINSDAYNLSKT